MLSALLYRRVCQIGGLSVRYPRTVVFRNVLITRPISKIATPQSFLALDILKKWKETYNPEDSNAFVELVKRTVSEKIDIRSELMSYFNSSRVKSMDTFQARNFVLYLGRLGFNYKEPMHKQFCLTLFERVMYNNDFQLNVKQLCICLDGFVDAGVKFSSLPGSVQSGIMHQLKIITTEDMDKRSTLTLLHSLAESNITFKNMNATIQEALIERVGYFHKARGSQEAYTIPEQANVLYSLGRLEFELTKERIAYRPLCNMALNVLTQSDTTDQLVPQQINVDWSSSLSHSTQQDRKSHSEESLLQFASALSGLSNMGTKLETLPTELQSAIQRTVIDNTCDWKVTSLGVVMQSLGDLGITWSALPAHITSLFTNTIKLHLIPPGAVSDVLITPILLSTTHKLSILLHGLHAMQAQLSSVPIDLKECILNNVEKEVVQGGGEDTLDILHVGSVIQGLGLLGLKTDNLSGQFLSSLDTVIANTLPSTDGHQISLILHGLSAMDVRFINLSVNLQNALFNSLSDKNENGEMRMKHTQLIESLQSLGKMGLQWHSLPTSLQAHLETVTAARFANLNEQAMSGAVYGLGKMGFSFLRASVELQSALHNGLVARLKNFSSKGVSMTVHGLGNIQQLHWRDLSVDLRSALETSLCNTLPSMEARQLLMTLHGLSALRPQFRDLGLESRVTIESVLTALIGGMDAHGVASAIFSLGQMQASIHDMPLELQNGLVYSFHTTVSAMNTTDLSTSLVGLSKLGVRWSTDLPSETQLMIQRKFSGEFLSNMTIKQLVRMSLTSLSAMNATWTNFDSSFQRAINLTLNTRFPTLKTGEILNVLSALQGLQVTHADLSSEFQSTIESVLDKKLFHMVLRDAGDVLQMLQDLNFPEHVQQELALSSKKIKLNEQTVTHSEAITQLHNAYNTDNVTEFVSLLTQYADQIRKLNSHIHNDLSRWLTNEWVATHVDRNRARDLLAVLSQLSYDFNNSVENKSVGLQLTSILLNTNDSAEHHIETNQALTFHDLKHSVQRLSQWSLEWSNVSPEIRLNVLIHLNNFLPDTSFTAPNITHISGEKRDEIVCFAQFISSMNDLKITWQDLPPEMDTNLLNYIRTHKTQFTSDELRDLSNCFMLMCFRSDAMITETPLDTHNVPQRVERNSDEHPQAEVYQRVFANTAHILSALGTKFTELSPELQVFIPQHYMERSFQCLPKSLMPTVLKMFGGMDLPWQSLSVQAKNMVSMSLDFACMMNGSGEGDIAQHIVDIMQALSGLKPVYSRLSQTLRDSIEENLRDSLNSMSQETVMDSLDAFSNLSAKWTQLPYDLQKGFEDRLVDILPLLNGHQLSSVLTTLPRLAVKYSDLGEECQTALQAAVLNYVMKVETERFLDALAQLSALDLHWSDVQLDLRVGIEAGIRKHVSTANERHLLRLLNGLVALGLSCGGSDLRADVRKDISSKGLRYLSKFLPEGQAECVELLGDLSISWSKLQEQKRMLLEGVITRQFNSLLTTDHMFLSVVSGLADMGATFDGMPPRMKSGLVECVSRFATDLSATKLSRLFQRLGSMKVSFLSLPENTQTVLSNALIFSHSEMRHEQLMRAVVGLTAMGASKEVVSEEVLSTLVEKLMRQKGSEQHDNQVVQMLKTFGHLGVSWDSIDAHQCRKIEAVITSVLSRMTPERQDGVFASLKGMGVKSSDEDDEM